MFTITQILDGNIYRVVADSELAKQTEESSDEVSFDDVFNSVADEEEVSEAVEAQEDDYEYDGSIYEVLSYYSNLAADNVEDTDDTDDASIDVSYDEAVEETVSVETSDYIDEVVEEVSETYEEADDLDSIFADASASTGVPVALLKAVAQAESGFDTNAVSYGGALGIMQLMPATCESYGVTDPFDARQNITAGAQVLAWMMDRYDGDVTLTLAAYNAGYGNVDKYGGVPPFSQTTAFIDKVMSLYNSYS